MAADAQADSACMPKIRRMAYESRGASRSVKERQERRLGYRHLARNLNGISSPDVKLSQTLLAPRPPLAPPWTLFQRCQVGHREHSMPTIHPINLSFRREQRNHSSPQVSQR